MDRRGFMKAVAGILSGSAGAASAYGPIADIIAEDLGRYGPPLVDQVPRPHRSGTGRNRRTGKIYDVMQQAIDEAETGDEIVVSGIIRNQTLTFQEKDVWFIDDAPPPAAIGSRHGVCTLYVNSRPKEDDGENQ